MGSSILRRICQGGVSDYNSLRCISAGISRSTNFWCGSKGGRISTVSVSDESILHPPSCLPSRASPWLMLPPDFEGRNMVYNFYSLAEDKVVSINKRGGGGGEEIESELPDDDAKLVGSSHGWVALFNQRNNDLFLSNPLSGRHIKLPPIDTLPNPKFNMSYGRGSMSKVIISCSPDEEEDECCAMMTFGPEDRLAFCRPCRSSEWTPIGDLYFEDEKGKWGRSYVDFAHSSKEKLFFCITKNDDLEVWDLTSCSPRMDWKVELDELELDEGDYPWSVQYEEESKLQEVCRHVRYLVFGEQSNQLFLVTRHVMERMGPDGSYVKSIYYGLRKGFDDSYPYKTIGFDVHRIDRENGRLSYMGGSLDGLAMFIGINHSFAISAAEFPELKPNSIYFTDAIEFTPPDKNLCDVYGGHDIGIFNYHNRTFAPCNYPCDVQSVKRIVPAPSWFTPSSHQF